MRAIVLVHPATSMAPQEPISFFAQELVEDRLLRGREKGAHLVESGIELSPELRPKLVEKSVGAFAAPFECLQDLGPLFLGEIEPVEDDRRETELARPAATSAARPTALAEIAGLPAAPFELVGSVPVEQPIDGEGAERSGRKHGNEQSRGEQPVVLHDRHRVLSSTA